MRLCRAGKLVACCWSRMLGPGSFTQRKVPILPVNHLGRGSTQLSGIAGSSEIGPILTIGRGFYDVRCQRLRNRHRCSMLLLSLVAVFA